MEVNISNYQVDEDKLKKWLNQYKWSDMTGYFIMNEMTYASILNNHSSCEEYYKCPLLKGKCVAFCNSIPFGKIEFATTSDR